MTISEQALSNALHDYQKGMAVAVPYGTKIERLEEEKTTCVYCTRNNNESREICFGCGAPLPKTSSLTNFAVTFQKEVDENYLDKFMFDRLDAMIGLPKRKQG